MVWLKYYLSYRSLMIRALLIDHEQIKAVRSQDYITDDNTYYVLCWSTTDRLKPCGHRTTSLMIRVLLINERQIKAMRLQDYITDGTWPAE